MNISIKQELGRGFEGVVYKSVIDGKPCITKLEKYDGDTSSVSTFVRQVDFNTFVKEHPRLNLLRLVTYGVNENCKLKMQLDKDWSAKTTELVKAKNKLTQCSSLSYTPVLQHTLYDMIPKMSERSKLQMFIQILEIIDAMRAAGYYHRDIHAKNIMYNGSWYLIDYGCIWHKKYTDGKGDKQFYSEFVEDIYSLLWIIAFGKADSFHYGNKLKRKSWSQLAKYIIADPRFTLKIRDANPHARDTMVVTACAICAPDLYMDAIGVPYKKYPELLTKIPQYYLYAVLHSRARDYGDIIKYLKVQYRKLQ